MLGELIKILSDEPEKINKAVLRGINVIFTLIICSYLYKIVIGSYTLISLSDYESLLKFLLSGQIIIALALYFITGYILIPFINLVNYPFIWVVSRGTLKLKKSDLKNLFSTLGIVKYSKVERIPSPGPNIDILYNLSISFNDEDSRNNIESLKQAFITNVINTVTVFFFIYFIVLEDYHNKLLTGIFLLCALLLLGIYRFIHLFYKYMLANYDSIIDGLDFIKYNALILAVFKKYQIVLNQGENELEKFKVFTLNNKEYVLLTPIRSGVKLKKNELERIIEKKRKPGRSFFLIGPKELLNISEEQLSENGNNLIIVQYIDKNDLEKQLKKSIELIIN